MGKKGAIDYILKSFWQVQLDISSFVQMAKHIPGKYPASLSFVWKLIYQLAYHWVQTCFYWNKWEHCHWLWQEQVHAPNEVYNGNSVHTKNLDTVSMRNIGEGFLRIPEHVNNVLHWHLSTDKKSEEIKWKNRTRQEDIVTPEQFTSCLEKFIKTLNREGKGIMINEST